jgi:hypothetical protein
LRWPGCSSFHGSVSKNIYSILRAKRS